MGVFFFIVHSVYFETHAFGAGFTLTAVGTRVKADGSEFETEDYRPEASWTWHYRFSETEAALDQIRVVNDAFSKNLKVFVKRGEDYWGRGIEWFDVQSQVEDTEDTYW